MKINLQDEVKKFENTHGLDCLVADARRLIELTNNYRVAKAEAQGMLTAMQAVQTEGAEIPDLLYEVYEHEIARMTGFADDINALVERIGDIV